MPRKFAFLMTTALAVGALAVVPAVTGARGAHATKVVLTDHCTATLTSQNPGKTKGVAFGFIKCKHFGRGVQVARFTDSVAKNGNATVTGITTTYGALGTDSGPYKLSGKLATNLKVSGKAKLIHGTGGYRNARATVLATCTSKDAGTHLNCKYTVRYTHL